MTYRDMTFCYDAPHCANKEKCGRWFTPEDEKKCPHWMPISFSSFKDDCPLYLYKDIEDD